MTLKEAREIAGLTQQQLERQAGLKPGAVHDIEAGRSVNPTWPTVHKIVTALHRAGLKGIRTEELFPVEVQR